MKIWIICFLRIKSIDILIKKITFYPLKTNVIDQPQVIKEL